MILALSDQQARLLRARAQRLRAAGAGVPAVQVVHAVCGVQAQDLPSGLLSLRPRSAGLTAAQIEQERAGGAIAWIWCMRGTLHLVSAGDARWLVPLLGPDLIAGDRRRSEQLGWDPDRTERGLRLLQDALADGAALTRAEIRGLLRENELPSEGQAPFHLIYRAVLEGLLCYGPDRGKEPTFTRFDTWLGSFELQPRPEALARLAWRYLEAYAPAAPADFASWSGIKLGEAREALNALSGQTAQVEVRGKPAWMLQSQLPWLEEAAAPLVRLLPRYDTYLLGYASRELSVDPRVEKRVHPGGGQISAVLLVDGMAAGTWSMRRKKVSLEVRVAPFEPLTGEAIRAIEAEAADLGRFLGEKTALLIEK